jgi:hypothetical protein
VIDPVTVSVPTEVRADSVRAVREYPGGVLLPVAFTTAELEGERWRPTGPGTEATPLGTWDSLAFYLRMFGLWQLGLDPAPGGPGRHDPPESL